MCNFIQTVKNSCISCCKKMASTRKIGRVIFVSVVFLLLALLLSGNCKLAFAIATIVSLFYLSVVWLFRKMGERLLVLMPEIVQSAAEEAVTTLAEIGRKIMDSDEIKQNRAEAEQEASAAKAAHEQICHIEKRVEVLYSLLKDTILPEMGYSFSDEEDKLEAYEWVACDILAKEIPAGIISLKISNRLNEKGIKTFADLVLCSESDILCIPDLGPSSVERIKQLLDVMGLHLQMMLKKENDVWYYHRDTIDFKDNDNDDINEISEE